MNKWSITGSWIGQYDYDPRPAIPNLAPISFTLQATQGWFGFFRGVVQEESTKGAPEPATVRGQVFGSQLVLRKWYPKFYVTDGTRWITLKTSIERDHRIVVDDEIAALPIMYWGEYNSQSETIIGSWQFEETYVSFKSEGKRLYLPFGKNTGKWFMHREV